MFDWLKRHRQPSQASQLYGAVVAQARQPRFFAEFGVPDTLEGRYEMIVVHLHALTERLQQEGEAGQALARDVLEIFVAEMDDSLREVGVGDMAVPRRIKRAAAGIYDRFGDYSAGLRETEGSLPAALALHIFGIADGTTESTSLEVQHGCQALATYMRRMAEHISKQPASRIMTGKIDFGRVDEEADNDPRTPT